MIYREFLRSQLWKTTAARLRRQANYRCENCGARNVVLHIHHKDYDHDNRADCPPDIPHGWLPPDDVLEVLCEPCHDDETGNDSWQCIQARIRNLGR